MTSETTPFIQRFDRHLKTVSRVWAHRLSGTLEAEFPARQRMRQIRFSGGGVIDRAQFTTLNASLRSDRLVFIEADVKSASDWRSVGMLLYRQARNRATQLIPMCSQLPPYELACPIEALRALPVDDVEALIRDTASMATFDERAIDVRALELMGLLTVTREYAPPPMALEEDLPVVDVEFTDLSLEGFSLSQCILAQTSSPERMRALWDQLRAEGPASCRQSLELELLTGMEQPSLLAFMGMCWFIDTDQPLPERVSRAKRWLSFAHMLESADQDVEKCIVAVQRLSRQLSDRSIRALPPELRRWLDTLSERACSSTLARV